MVIKFIWYYKKPAYAAIMAITALMLFNPGRGVFSQEKGLNDVNYKTYFVIISAEDSTVNLPDKFIIENTVTVYADSVEISSSDYNIDYRYGKINFTAECCCLLR